MNPLEVITAEAIGEIDVWEIPLTRESVQRLQLVEETVSSFRERLDDHITSLHAARIKAYEAAGLSFQKEMGAGGYFESKFSEGAGCTFEGFNAKGDILYSGVTWFRNEKDSFSASNCIPLPGHLLDLSREEGKRFFAEQAEVRRQALATKRQAELEQQEIDRIALERQEYERLRAKFG